MREEKGKTGVFKNFSSVRFLTFLLNYLQKKATLSLDRQLL